MRRIAALVLGLAGVLGIVAVAATPAAAIFDPGPLPGQDPSAEAEVQIVGTRLAGGVEGTFNGIVTDPVIYPQPQGTPVAEGTALIRIQDVSGTGPVAEAYCVNLVTSTYVGTRYEASDWATGGVANSTYIAYILTTYFPATALPANVSDVDRVRAVQSAIWFFSDGYVLSNTDPLARERTRAIVEATIAAVQGNPLPPPAPPVLRLTPDSAAAPSDDPTAGPFTVSFSGAATPATVQAAAGLQLFADAARTVPVPVGSAVIDGQRLWVGGASPASTFTIGADYSVTAGTLYTADPNPSRFQKIVLAQTSTLPVRASATISIYPANAVTITKRIDGDRAGRQGEIAFEVRCDPAPDARVVTRVTIPAGASAGDHVRTVAGLRAGSSCSVVEIADGSNAAALLSGSSITPVSFTVPAAGQPAASVIARDTYIRPQPILPVTGAPELAGAAVAGGGLIAVGLLALVLRRRRRA